MNYFFSGAMIWLNLVPAMGGHIAFAELARMLTQILDCRSGVAQFLPTAFPNAL